MISVLLSSQSKQLHRFSGFYCHKQIEDNSFWRKKLILEQARDWHITYPFVSSLFTMLVGLLLGALASWLITVRYYRKSSRETPKWVGDELLPLLEQREPNVEKIVKLIIKRMPQHNVLETCSNNDGHWFRYKNGDQTCTGSFVIPANEASIYVPFPQGFSDNPAVEISGEVGRIAAKRPTRSDLKIELIQPSEQPLEFTYQARGHWKNPHEVGTNDSP